MRAVIFDLDDTLYPERDFVFSGFRAVAAWAEKHLHIPAEDGICELCGLFEEGVRGNTFDHWVKGRGLDPGEWVSQLVRVYLEHRPQIAPFPGIPALLQRLHRRYLLGLVSDGDVAVQQRKLASLELDSHFDAVVFSDEFGREHRKPDPRPFEAILQRLGVTSGRSLYVADNPIKDFIGARHAGMGTVRIRAPLGIYSHLEPRSDEYAADAELTDLNGLEETLTQFGGLK